MSPSDEARTRALEDERRRVHRMRTLVDLTCQVLMQAPMTRPEAERLVAATRARVLELFPEKAETFDLILAPRFERLMREHVGPPQSRGRLLPFPKR